MKFTLKLIAKLIVQLLGIFILIPVTYKYQLGRFPYMFRWWDDYKARWCVAREHIDPNIMSTQFGNGHTLLFDTYNSTWKGRYVWAAFRNTCNYFQHEPLGIWYLGGYIQHNYGYIPLVFGFKLRYNIGYKYFNREHADYMASLGIPLQFVFSLGIRRSDT